MALQRISIVIAIIFIIIWYIDLYKLIINCHNNLIVKNKLINLCIYTIIIFFLTIIILE